MDVDFECFRTILTLMDGRVSKEIVCVVLRKWDVCEMSMGIQLYYLIIITQDEWE